MAEENKKGLSKKFWCITILVCLLLIIVVAIGITLFCNRKEITVNEEKNGGNVVLNYTSNTNILNVTNATPTTDLVGMSNNEQYFDFSIEVDLDKANYIEYEVSVNKVDSLSTIIDNDIRIYLEQEKSGTYTKIFGPEKFEALTKDTKLGSKKGSMVIAKMKKDCSSSDNYRLRIWLSDKSLSVGGNYSIEINVTGDAK